jgi:hypothetical protein
MELITYLGVIDFFEEADFFFYLADLSPINGSILKNAFSLLILSAVRILSVPSIPTVEGFKNSLKF